MVEEEKLGTFAALVLLSVLVSLFLALTFSCPSACINNVLSQDQAREALTLSS